MDITDGPTEGGNEPLTYRDAMPHLKKKKKEVAFFLNGLVRREREREKKRRSDEYKRGWRPYHNGQENWKEMDRYRRYRAITVIFTGKDFFPRMKATERDMAGMGRGRQDPEWRTMKAT